MKYFLKPWVTPVPPKGKKKKKDDNLRCAKIAILIYECHRKIVIRGFCLFLYFKPFPFVNVSKTWARSILRMGVYIGAFIFV
jgi:hypothetical protein